MRFSVGYQADTAWIDELVVRQDVIHDVYFAFGAMPSGRMAVADTERQLEDLGRIADAGIPLHLLFNANCYGEEAISKVLEGKIRSVIDFWPIKIFVPIASRQHLPLLQVS